MSYATYPPIPKGGHQLLVEQGCAQEGLQQLDRGVIQKHMTITHRGVVARLEDGSEHDANAMCQPSGQKCLGYYAFVIFKDGTRSGA